MKRKTLKVSAMHVPCTRLHLGDGLHQTERNVFFTKSSYSDRVSFVARSNLTAREDTDELQDYDDHYIEMKELVPYFRACLIPLLAFLSYLLVLILVFRS